MSPRKSRVPRIEGEVVRTGRPRGPKNEKEMAAVRRGGQVTAIKRRLRKELGLTRYGSPPTPEEAAQAERRRLARRTLEDARVHLIESTQAAADLLRIAVDEEVSPTQIAAAREILGRAGIPVMTQVENVGGPAVVVHLGPMPKYPSPDADRDGVEPEEGEDDA